MGLVRLRFVRPSGVYNIHEVAAFEAEEAHGKVAAKIAVYVDPKDAPPAPTVKAPGSQTPPADQPPADQPRPDQHAPETKPKKAKG